MKIKRIGITMVQVFIFLCLKNELNEELKSEQWSRTGGVGDFQPIIR